MHAGVAARGSSAIGNTIRIMLTYFIVIPCHHIFDRRACMAKRQPPSPPNLHRMNPFGGASVPVKPPEKGSFPLDRAGQVSQRGRGVWKEEEVDA